MTVVTSAEQAVVTLSGQDVAWLAEALARTPTYGPLEAWLGRVRPLLCPSPSAQS